MLDHVVRGALAVVVDAQLQPGVIAIEPHCHEAGARVLERVLRRFRDNMSGQGEILRRLA